MRYLKRFNESTKEDFQYSDRDITNKYHCAKGWVRYTDLHKDSYIDIEKYFDITWDHLGWILEDFVNTCDLFYQCSARDSVGRIISDPDSDGADNITIEFIPEKFERVGGHSGVNFKTHMNRKKDILPDILENIDKKLEDFWLTIKNDGNTQGNVGDWNLFTTTSQITLKIKRK
jgi:hypothetical protein